MSGAIDHPRDTRWRLVLKPTLLLAGVLAGGIALRALPHRFDPALIDRFVAGHGLSGEALFVLIGAATCAVGLPRQLVGFAGGYAFGLWGGAALALLAQTLGCLANFTWARFLARGWATRRMGPRLRRLDGFLAARPFRATLTLRLLPVGNNLALNLLAGVSALRVGPFLAASILGYLPQTVIFALLGGGVRVSESVQVAIATGLFAACVILGLLLLRDRRTARVSADAA
jgi:uncharacterized membrane protein YdjX (TVP38/TMEM64 family)